MTVFEKIALRFRLLIGRAILTAISDSAGLQSVDADGLPGEKISRADRFQNYGLSSCPLPGAEGVAVAVAGCRGHLVFVAVDDPRHRPKDLAPGEVALYTDERLAICLKRGDEIEVRGDTLDLEVDSDATLTAGAGGKFEAMTTLDLKGGTTVTISGNAVNVSALMTAVIQAVTSITLQAPAVTVNGALILNGNMTGISSSISLQAPSITLDGDVTITGACSISGQDFESHDHAPADDGDGTTGPVNM